MKAGEFWRETISMLGKEWRMCVYCIILMTWVCFDRYLGSYWHPLICPAIVQLLFPHIPRLVHHLHAH